MLKTAYQLGMQKALQEENFVQLLKEAQALGIDVEKLAFGLGSLGGMAAKGLGWAGAHPVMSRALGGAALGGAYSGMTGGDVGKGMLMGGGLGAGYGALGGMSGISNRMGKFMQGGPTGGMRSRFMEGFRPGGGQSLSPFSAGFTG